MDEARASAPRRSTPSLRQALEADMNRIQAAQLQRNRESLRDVDTLSSKLMEALDANDELRFKLSDVEERSGLKAKEDAAATSAATAKLEAAQRQLAGMQSAVEALTKRNESLEKDLERVTADYAADRELWKSFKEWWTGVVATNMAKQGAKKPRVDERGREILRKVGLDTPEMMDKRPSSSGSAASTTSAGGTSTSTSRRRSDGTEATTSKQAAPRESTPRQHPARESTSKQSESRESAAKHKGVRYSASRPNAASTSRPAAASSAVAVTPTPKPRGVSANVAATPSALRNSVAPLSPGPRPITEEALKQAAKDPADLAGVRLNKWMEVFNKGPGATNATSITGGHVDEVHVVTEAGPSKPREAAAAAAAAAARKEGPPPNGGPVSARPREALAPISQPNSQEEVASSSATAAAATRRQPRAPLPRRTQGGSEGAWQRCASSSQEMLSSAARRNSSTTPGLSQICSIKAESDDEADREVAVCRVPTRRRFEGPNDDDYVADEPQQRGGSRPARSRAEEEKEQEELLRRRRRAELDEMNRDPEGYRRRRAAALGLERYAAAGRGNGTSNSRGNISAHYEIDPALNGGEAHEHVAVVRDKATRKRMHAHDCPCCKDYWDITAQAEAAMTRERGETEDAGSSSRVGVAAAAAAAKKRPRRSEPAGAGKSRATSGEAVFEQMRALGAGTTSNGNRTADGNAEEENHEQDRLHNERLQKAGRHRAWGRPPATPEGYWDLGFPSTSRQNAINEAADRQRDAMWEQIQHDPRYKRRKRG